MKKLIAYSSVAHMGFVTLGIFSFTQQGIEGAYFQMISHGIVSGALFLCVGVVYDRLHTREISQYGGVTNIMPYFAAVFMLFTMASAGLPGTSGFVGEILVIVGAYQAASWSAVLAATGLILGAAYMLLLYRRVMFGEVTNPEVAKMPDMSVREWLVFLPLILMVLWLGVQPNSMMRSVSPSIVALLDSMERPLPGESENAAAEEVNPEPVADEDDNNEDEVIPADEAGTPDEEE